MNRIIKRRSGWRERSTDQQRDPYSAYRSNQDDRTWGLSPTYRERFGHAGSRENSRRYVAGEEYNPNRYQYYAGQEDYPGPGRPQGFSSDYNDYRRQRSFYDRHFRETDHQPGADYNYRSSMEDMSEYGYGSGSVDMPSRRTWDIRGDESYDWGEHARERSWARGEHRGKGPKGYKRLDERIREEINDILSDDHELDASEIVVSVQDGEVSLSGVVSDRASKRRAEDLVEEVSGVTNVENRIRIGKVTPEEPISREKDGRDTVNRRSRSLTG
jgi:hypothetical protein